VAVVVDQHQELNMQLAAEVLVDIYQELLHYK
jgi:hypothetical protein